MGHIFVLPWDSLIHIYEQLLKSVVFLKRNLQTREAAATAFKKQLQSWVVSLLCLIQFRNAISCTVAIFIVYFLLYSMWRVCTCLIFFVLTVFVDLCKLCQVRSS